MKKVVAVALVAFAGMATVNAQNVSLGPVASFNHSWITGTSQSDRQFNPGFKVGATLTYSINPNWGVGGDLLFANEGAKAEATVGNTKFTNKTNLNYIRIPLKGTYFFGSLGDRFRPKLYAGPSFGILAGGKIISETENHALGTKVRTEANSRDSYNGFDFGAIVGTGFNYRIGTATWLNFDLNYTNGFSDITKSDASFLSNRNYGIGLGVTFPIGTYTPEK
ncbi:MAG: porin family protein [Bacteroidota bacterium]